MPDPPCRQRRSLLPARSRCFPRLHHWHCPRRPPTHEPSRRSRAWRQGNYRQYGVGTGSRPVSIRNHYRVTTTVGHLHVGQGECGVAGCGQGYPVESPLVAQGGRACCHHAQRCAASNWNSLALRLRYDCRGNRSPAFTGAAGIVYGGNLSGRKGTAVNRSLVNQTVKIAIIVVMPANAQIAARSSNSRGPNDTALPPAHHCNTASSPIGHTSRPHGTKSQWR